MDRRGEGRMKILNLFAGIGGNRTLWGTQHQITAIENNEKIAEIYKKRFPQDEIIITDAYEYLLWNYDKFEFIWASPPCQTHSWANNWLHTQGIRRYPDMALWQLIIFLRKFSDYKNYGKKLDKIKILYVVENVKPYYESLIKPDFILQRHYFWSNIQIPNEGFKFSKISIINAKAKTRRNNQDYYQQLCDYHHINKEIIDLLRDKTWNNHDLKGQVLRNCVRPELGKYILDYITNQTQQKLEAWLRG